MPPGYFVVWSGGMVSSTVLTLIVIPAIYALVTLRRERRTAVIAAAAAQ